MHTFTRFFTLLLVGSVLVPVFAWADSSESSSSSSSLSSSSSSSSASSSSSSSSEGKRRKTLQPVTAACVQTAVDAREQAVLSAVTAYTSSLVSAFQQKKTALHNAWSITDTVQRKASVKSAWAAFTQSKKSAKKTYKDARQTAWSTFKKAAKLCNESMSDEVYKANEDF